MRFPSRLVTIVLWTAVAGTAAAWLWPDAGSPSASPALKALLALELAVGFAGWAITMVAWVRARGRHASGTREST
jgi:hypothetical protein